MNETGFLVKIVRIVSNVFLSDEKLMINNINLKFLYRYLDLNVS